MVTLVSALHSYIGIISILSAMIGYIGHKCVHNPFFLLLFAVSASTMFLRDLKKEESRIFFDLFMVGLIIVGTIKVLFF